MSDDGDDARGIDELLCDLARANAIAGVVGEHNVQAPAALPRGASVNLVQRQLNSVLVCFTVGLGPRSRGTKGDRSAGWTSCTCAKSGEEQKPFHN